MDIDPERANELETPPQDKVQALRSQVDGVIETLVKNMESLFIRQENLEKLEKVSEGLEEKAKEFKQTSQKVARTYWWKNVKLIVVIVVVVLVIVLIIILLATGVIPVGSSTAPPAILPTKKP
ncbi:unnamed protein product [Lota lota]